MPDLLLVVDCSSLDGKSSMILIKIHFHEDLRSRTKEMRRRQNYIVKPSLGIHGGRGESGRSDEFSGGSA